MRNMYVFFYLLLFCSCVVSAQTFFPAKKYPIGQYTNPLNIPISLAGNFGECRPNHFHSGIDIRTNKVENLPIYSIQDGYVSRVKIEAGGFGNAIYISHADGYTAVYAHLNKFFPALEEHLRHLQYEAKSWKIDTYFKPHQFPIRQGKFIAWSGNTGSSQAPHLHLEIRDTKTEAPLNPLLFFSNLPDTKPPVIKQLALYDGNKSIYEQTPIIVPIATQGKSLKPSKPFYTIPSNKVFIGIVGDDYMENALGTLGIYEMQMYVEDAPYFAWQHDNISYDVTRYMNAMADYTMKKKGGSWIQLCAKLPNNRLEIYKDLNGKKGMIEINHGETKQVRIVVLDAKGNKNELSFSLQGGSNSSSTTCNVFCKSGKKNNPSTANSSCALAEDALYDDICFVASVRPSANTYSHIYQIHHNAVPVHSYFEVQLQPKVEIPPALREKLIVQRLPERGENTKKGKSAKYSNGKVIASIREFGNYEIAIDQTPPKISTALVNNSSVTKLKIIKFQVKDAETSVQKCVVELDGKWLRLVQKGDMFYYEMDEHFPIGSHQLSITAIDESNNVTKKNFTLSR